MIEPILQYLSHLSSRVVTLTPGVRKAVPRAVLTYPLAKLITHVCSFSSAGFCVHYLGPKLFQEPLQPPGADRRSAALVIRLAARTVCEAPCRRAWQERISPSG
jgi:hypothetical protein